MCSVSVALNEFEFEFLYSGIKFNKEVQQRALL
jgi:hypothetical protein